MAVFTKRMATLNLSHGSSSSRGKRTTGGGLSKMAAADCGEYCGVGMAEADKFGSSPAPEDRFVVCRQLSGEIYPLGCHFSEASRKTNYLNPKASLG